jgi:two-component system, OmpR family, sensor histidine kinase BaeS
VRTIIHEIRNQLAVAVANVEAFLDGKLVPTKERLEGILQVLTELDTLVDELGPHIPSSERNVRLEPTAKMREIDVCALIANAALSIEATALAKGLRYEISRCEHKHSACAKFFGDPSRIAEVVQNILLNAIRYTPSGGTVSVDCRRSCTELVFSVCDDGLGIAAEEKAKIFEPGFRGSASDGIAGSGLGLSVVKRFVEEYGGKVLVESKDMQGATFTISLPGATSAATEELLPRII